MPVNFNKLSLADLSKASVVPQALDNQWVPSNLLAKMIARGKNLVDIKTEREKAVRQEWHRALIYSDHVVVPLAYLYNNAVVVDDYDDSNNRKSFKKLLNDQVIIPFLFTEKSPDETPRFDISHQAMNNWREVLTDTQISCVRLNWGEQETDFKRFSRNFHDYFQRISGQAQTEHLASYFSIKPESFPQFQNLLQRIERSAFKRTIEGGFITRSWLYREFIISQGTNLSEGLYRQEMFTAIIKKIVDLKYAVLSFL